MFVLRLDVKRFDGKVQTEGQGISETRWCQESKPLSQALVHGVPRLHGFLHLLKIFDKRTAQFVLLLFLCSCVSKVGIRPQKRLLLDNRTACKQPSSKIWRFGGHCHFMNVLAVHDGGSGKFHFVDRGFHVRKSSRTTMPGLCTRTWGPMDQIQRNLPAFRLTKVCIFIPFYMLMLNCGDLDVNSGNQLS